MSVDDDSWAPANGPVRPLVQLMAVLPPERLDLGTWAPTSLVYNCWEKTFLHRHPVPIRIGEPKAWYPQARAGVAQLVERKALNLVVKGSSPFFGDTHLNVFVCFAW